MKVNTKITYEIARSLFVMLESDRPEISLSGLHVQLLTDCFYEFLPFSLKMSIDVDELSFGALLHDIGKIGVPIEILNKPGKLKKEEMELVKSHAELSEKMLGSIHGLEGVAKWVKYHHERVDGRGYYKLKGSRIPLEARIIAITESYSSIVLPSSFKPARNYEDAITVLKMGAGSQFDAGLVENFCKIPQQELMDTTQEAITIFKNSRYSVQGG